MQDVGVEFAQSSGESISAQVLSTELTDNTQLHILVKTTHSSSRVVLMEAAAAVSYLLHSFLGRLTSRM